MASFLRVPRRNAAMEMLAGGFAATRDDNLVPEARVTDSELGAVEAGDPGAGATEGAELKRTLGPFSATSVVIGAIIGVGIFFTPQKVAKVAGSGEIALLAWFLGGGIALVGALTFAELGGMYRRAGGQYEILRDSYGPLPAFLFVFCNATWIQAGAIAIIAIICVENLGQGFAGDVPSETTTGALALALIAGLVLINVLGVKRGAAVQNATVVAKLITIAVIAGLAALLGGHEVTGPSTAEASSTWLGPVGLVFAALVPTAFSFGGWQHALWIGGEVKDPGKNVPRAILGGVAIVILAYLVVNVAYLALLGPEGVAASHVLAADAVAEVWPGGRRIVAIAVAFSAFGVLNAQLLSGPRLLYAMARDGRFFPSFAAVHPRFGTPARAIFLLGALSAGLLIAAGKGGVDKLLTGVVLVDGFFFVLTGAAVFVLRRRRPGAERSVRVPFYPWVPAIFVVGEGAVLLGTLVDPGVRAAALTGGLWIAGAAILYRARFARGGRPA